ncbi:Hypothetical predicted protein [Mytilus galloprovincialis]|uniref:Uncharacterized protein n=1 Tax=Mytilus galloprovincialis TaxID=29158 RepID=A0A8B6CHQ4_MYTGA|nr:Hypothetical predicted protein [Mytilus galloprovincialis]
MKMSDDDRFRDEGEKPVNVKTTLNMTLLSFGSALFVNYIAEIVQLSYHLNVPNKHIAVIGSIVLSSSAIAMILLYSLAYMFTKRGHEQKTMVLFVVAFSCLSFAISALGIVIAATD